jgi:hypothetical protein
MWDVLQKIGRMGTWAANCWLNPSWKNHRVALFRELDSVVKQRIDRGADGPSLTSVVENAEILTPSTLHIRLRHDDTGFGANNGLVLDIVEIVENKRRRTLQSKGSDGKDYIKDGIMLGPNAPSVWVSKCAD